MMIRYLLILVMLLGVSSAQAATKDMLGDLQAKLSSNSKTADVSAKDFLKAKLANTRISPSVDGSSITNPSSQVFQISSSQLNQTFQSSLEQGGDEDFFRIELAEAGLLNVQTDGFTDTFGTLLNESGGTIDLDDDSGANFNFSVQTFLAAGTYFIKVEGFNSSTTGAYSITATLSFGVQGDDHGGSIRTPSSTVITSPRIRPLGFLEPNDVDVFRIEVPSRRRLIIESRGSTDTIGQLLDADGNIITSNDDILFDGFDSPRTNLNFRIDRVLDAGTYFIAVTGFDGSVGLYRLRARFRRARDDLRLDGQDIDRFAARQINHSRRRVVGLNARFDQEGDVDMFRITVPTAGLLEISTRGNSDTVGSLFNAAGSSLATADDIDFFGDNLNFSISEFVQAGTYFIQVNEFGDNTGSYRLRSRFTSAGNSRVTEQPRINR